MRHHDSNAYRDRDSTHQGHNRRFARTMPLEAGEAYDRHRHGGRRRRLFNHGDLRFILLSIIASKPAHGYDLIKALENRMGGGYSPSPGVIYPTLTMLDEQGYVTNSVEGGRKLYTLTQEGLAFLQENQATVDAIQLRIGGRAREQRIEAPPRIIRAVENLKTALRLRLVSDAIDEERAAAIAAAIDAAAAEVERT